MFFYSRLNFSNQVTLPFANMPFQAGQAVYYDNVNKTSVAFDHFVFSFDKNTFIREQRKKLVFSDSLEALQNGYPSLDDSIRKLEDLKSKAKNITYLEEKVKTLRYLEAAGDSIHRNIPIDTSAYNVQRHRMEELQKAEKEYATLYQSCQKAKQALDIQRQEMNKKIEASKSLPDDSLFSNLKARGLLSKQEEIIKGFRTFSVGKSRLMYPSFFTVNVPITGFHAAYLTGKHLFLAMAVGNEASYYSDVYSRNLSMSVNRNIRYFRVGKGDVSESYSHIVYMDFKNRYDNPGAFPFQELANQQNGTLLSLESQQYIGPNSKVNAEVMYSIGNSAIGIEEKSADQFGFVARAEQEIHVIQGNLSLLVANTGTRFNNPYSRSLPPGSSQVEIAVGSQFLKEVSIHGAVKQIRYDESIVGSKKVFHAYEADLRYSPASQLQMNLRFMRSLVDSKADEMAQPGAYSSDILLYNLTSRFRISKKPVVTSSTIGYTAYHSELPGFNFSKSDLLFNAMLTSNLSRYLNPSACVNLVAHGINLDAGQQGMDYKAEVDNKARIGKAFELTVGTGCITDQYGIVSLIGKAGMNYTIGRTISLGALYRGIYAGQYNAASHTFANLNVTIKY